MAESVNSDSTFNKQLVSVPGTPEKFKKYELQYLVSQAATSPSQHQY